MNADTPYAKFAGRDLILRDELAIDRTLLANERTLLAYLRSGISLLLAGVTIMHFAEGGWFGIVGVACLPSGVIAGLVGVVRYRRMDGLIAMVRRNAKPSSAAAGSGEDV